MKIILPVLLSGIIMIAGIFAFIPIDKATTVHTTIQSTQLNNVQSNFNLDLSTNSTAKCASGDFLVYYTFTNATFFGQGTFPGEGASTLTQLGIQDNEFTGGTDIIVTLVLGNHTSSSGVIGGDSGEIINFFGAANGSSSSISIGEDVGDLTLTVICQSGQAPTLVPAP